MLIEKIYTRPIENDRLEVGATWNGGSFHYRFPAERFCPQAVGDILVLSVLAPAMLTGTAVQLPDDCPISSRLLDNLGAIQRILAGWNPSLKKVAVHSNRYDPRPSDGGVGLFYAGGVDSSYSLGTLRDEVDTLICCYGFDFAFTDDEIRESIERNGKIASALGKKLVAVETSHSAFVISQGVSRQFVFGLTLACIGLLLGFRRCHIASSHSPANLRPTGSHPILDGLFSNGITEIVHDEPVSRLEKTWMVAKNPVLLENLRVCWHSHHENCGNCSKCLRTMAALRLIGVDGPFPKLKTLRQFRDMAAQTETEFSVELVLAAHAKGDREMVRELKKGIRRNDRRAALQHIDRAFFSGQLRSLYRVFAYPEPDLLKWELRGDMKIS